MGDITFALRIAGEIAIVRKTGARGNGKTRRGHPITSSPGAKRRHYALPAGR